jgi:hypothetical protein
VTTLVQRMHEELVRKLCGNNHSDALKVIEDFRRYVDKRLDQLGPDDIRRHQVHLLEGGNSGSARWSATSPPYVSSM